MSDLDIEDRIKLAVQFIAQSPPGEVNDVIQDIAAIIGDNEALTPHVAAALKVYNLAQMTTVEHAADGDVPAHVSLLSPATTVPGDEDRYIDAESKRSFAFDHVRLVASDYRPYILPEADEAFRAELATSLLAYARNHFTEGCSSVSTNQVPLAPAAPAAPAAAEGDVKEEAAEGDVKEEAAEGDVKEEAAEGAATAEKSEKVSEADPVDAATTGVGGLSVTGSLEPSPEGMIERESTPTEGEPAKLDDHEVDVPGGLEKLDEEMAEVQGEAGDEDEETKEAAKRAKAAETEAVEAGEAADAKEDAEAAKEAETVEEAQVHHETPAAAAPPQPAQLENPLFVLEIVGNRYKASNFWTGRWRTRWTVDRAAGTVSGVINVDVHYYEQGNVQLATKHEASFPCPTEPVKGQSVASQIVTAIAKIETNYQLEMNDVYEYMDGTAFRSLRRALPVTRQKIDWDKVQGYALGSEVSRARASA